MKRRFLSIILSASLIFGACAINVNANETNNSEGNAPEMAESIQMINPLSMNLLITEDNISKNYNAKEIQKLGPITLLEFDNQEEMEKAIADMNQDGISAEKNEIIELELAEGETNNEDIPTEKISGGTMSDGIKNMGLDLLSSQIENSSNKRTVKVALIDTGVDITNRDITDRLDKYYDCVNRNADTTDTTGHGTHVAGTIIDGTASNTRLYVYKVFGSDNKATTASMLYAFYYAIFEDEVDIINLSLGAVDNDVIYNHYDSMLKVAYDRNIIICSAGGNNYNHSSLHYSSNSAYTICVGGLPLSNGESYVYGDGVDFVALGEGVKSFIPTYIDGGTPYYDEYGTLIGTTGIKNGTSMATPHIVAAFADLLSFHEYSVQEAKSMMIGYCEDLGESGKDDTYGYGMPNFSGLDLEDLMFYSGNSVDYVSTITNQSTTVIITNKSTYSISLPKTIVLDGNKSSDTFGMAEYNIYVNGDIAGNESVRVSADEKILMSTPNKHDIEGTITLDKKSWTCSDISSEVVGTGRVVVENLTAGQWEGTFTFHIALKETSQK